MFKQNPEFVFNYKHNLIERGKHGDEGTESYTCHIIILIDVAGRFLIRYKGFQIHNVLEVPFQLPNISSVLFDS